MSTYERCKVICDRERRSLWEYLCFVLVPLKKLTTEAIEIADSHEGKATARSGYRIDATGAEHWLSMLYWRRNKSRLVSWSKRRWERFDGAIRGTGSSVVVLVFCEALASAVMTFSVVEQGKRLQGRSKVS